MAHTAHNLWVLVSQKAAGERDVGCKLSLTNGTEDEDETLNVERLNSDLLVCCHPVSSRLVVRPVEMD
jgi:hypothetical protein